MTTTSPAETNGSVTPSHLPSLPSDQPAAATPNTSTTTSSPLLADPTLALAADILDDLERVRIANENRLRQLTRTATDSDGEERGFGLDVGHPDVAHLAGMVRALRCDSDPATSSLGPREGRRTAGCCLEHDAERSLRKALQRHPLHPWIKAQKGIGDKQGARMLAATRDPYWNDLHHRPRTVSELWAFCGLHTLPAGQSPAATRAATAGGGQTGDPGQTSLATLSASARVAAKRRKGVRSNWSATAKMRAFLVAQKCVQTLGSPYRDVYLARREHTTTSHPEWTPGHSHNDAIRITAKRILRDLWRAARDLHDPAQARRITAPRSTPLGRLDPGQAEPRSAPAVQALIGLPPVRSDTPPAILLPPPEAQSSAGPTIRAAS